MIHHNTITDSFEIYAYRDGRTKWIGHSMTRQEANKILERYEMMHRNDQGLA